MATTHESALFDISQKLEDPFQLPLDFSENGYVSLEDFGISSLFDDIPITQMEREMEAFLLDLTYNYDRLYSSLFPLNRTNFNYLPLQDFIDDVYCNGLGINNEKKQPLPSGESEGVDNNMSGSSKMVLTREMLSKYFYMPITKSARELTILKKRCRELGIGRWPHRKLKSLNALINNIQQGEESDETKRELIQELERERRMIEEMPNVEMQKQTKRLRQSCFKDNYRKRKRMSMPIADHHQPSTSTSTSTCTTSSAENIEPTYYGSCQEYEEQRSLLSSPDFMF